MNVRTGDATITFDHAFHLRAAEADLPAGPCREVTDAARLP